MGVTASEPGSGGEVGGGAVRGARLDDWWERHLAELAAHEWELARHQESRTAPLATLMGAVTALCVTVVLGGALGTDGKPLPAAVVWSLGVGAMFTASAALVLWLTLVPFRGRWPGGRLARALVARVERAATRRGEDARWRVRWSRRLLSLFAGVPAPERHDRAEPTLFPPAWGDAHPSDELLCAFVEHVLRFPSGDARRSWFPAGQPSRRRIMRRRIYWWWANRLVATRKSRMVLLGVALGTRGVILVAGAFVWLWAVRG